MLRALLLSVALGVPASSALALPVTFAALATAGTGQCAGSCSNISVSREVGGGALASATTELIDPKGVVRSEARLTGVDLLPALKVFADADGASDFARATATGVQAFSNGGADRTITLILDFIVDAYEGDAEVNGQVAVFRANALSDLSSDFGTTAFEIGFDDLAQDIDGAPAVLQILTSPSLSNVSPDTTTLSFDVAAGENFLVWAGMQAQADFGGLADAFGTMALRFDDGSRLQAASVGASSSVPAPGAILLLSCGIAGLGAIRMMRCI